MGGEGEDVLQERRSQVRAALKHALQRRRRQLEQHAVGLRLRPLAALHKALPHLRILPHLRRGNISYLWTNTTQEINSVSFGILHKKWLKTASLWQDSSNLVPKNPKTSWWQTLSYGLWTHHWTLFDADLFDDEAGQDVHYEATQAGVHGEGLDDGSHEQHGKRILLHELLHDHGQNLRGVDVLLREAEVGGCCTKHTRNVQTEQTLGRYWRSRR